MPTANHDASRITQRKRAVVMYNWNLANNTAIVAGQSVRREQPNTQLGELLTYRRTTKAFVTTNNGCPCSSEVLDDPSGGGNSNNVQ